MITIEVAYVAADGKQTLLTLVVAEGTTVAEALKRADMAKHHPELDMTTVAVGIFSQKVARDRVLSPGDRIELYRALTIDPMQRRRLLATTRAQQKQQSRGS